MLIFFASGKSSLVLSLCQLLEQSCGSISIDGVDLASVDKAILRSRIAVVPQDPLVFDDLTIRENLNLLGESSDSDIELVLDKVGLWGPSLTNSDLARPMSDVGLSQGRKQLFCIGRALLRNSRLIIFDEATSR